MIMKVSIITCTYNSERTISDTLLSINMQTYQNIEHIIIDGMSNDGTLDIVKKNLTERQIVFSERDNGIYDAMNKGIQMATGDIIGILNSDDFFTKKTVVETIVRAFEQNDIDAVYGDIHFVKSDNLLKCVRYYSSRIFRLSLMRFGFMPAHPSFYVKKQCYDKLGLYNIAYQIGADFELLLRYIYINRIKVMYIPFDFVTMRMGGISTSGIRSRIRIMREHLRAFRDNGVYTNVFLLSLRYIYKLTEYRK